MSVIASLIASSNPSSNNSGSKPMPTPWKIAIPVISLVGVGALALFWFGGRKCSIERKGSTNYSKAATTEAVENAEIITASSINSGEDTKSVSYSSEGVRPEGSNGK